MNRLNNPTRRGRLRNVAHVTVVFGSDVKIRGSEHNPGTLLVIKVTTSWLQVIVFSSSYNMAIQPGNIVYQKGIRERPHRSPGILQFRNRQLATEKEMSYI
jgi:hypothetical protein